MSIESLNFDIFLSTRRQGSIVLEEKYYTPLEQQGL